MDKKLFNDEPDSAAESSALNRISVSDLTAGRDFDELLTEQQVIRLLGLEDRSRPDRRMKQLRVRGLRCVRLGYGLRRYRRCDVRDFLDRLANQSEVS